MNIYYSEHSISDGFSILDAEHKEGRTARGKRVCRPSGWNLFTKLRDAPIQCCFCGIIADRWVADKGRADKQGYPVLNLYAGTKMMTRDHIIPKSLGGRDDHRNLRPACAPCNEARSNEVTPEVIRFAEEHPELIDKERVRAGMDKLRAACLHLERCITQNEAELVRIRQPFIDMGYL